MKIELEVEKEVEDEDCIKVSLSSMTFSLLVIPTSRVSLLNVEDEVDVEVRIDFDTLFDSDLVFGVAVAVAVTLELDVGVGVDVEVVEGRRSRDDGVREGKVTVKSFSPTTVWSAFFPSLCCLLKKRIFSSDVPYG